MTFPLTRRVLLCLLVTVAAISVSSSRVSAQLPKSLDTVPADVSFYSSSLRLREQFDAFVNSNAYAKLKEMPVVQMGLGFIEQQWNDPTVGGQFQEMLKQPENKQLVDLLIDGVSHEVFIYGDEGFADLFELYAGINQAQMASIGNPQAMPMKMMEVLNKYLDDAEVPTMVIGLRITEKDPALAQLARLEQMAGFMLGQQPGLAERFSRKPIAGGDFLTLQLDGSLIPWDQIPPNVLSQFDGLQDKVTKMTLSISLGVKDDYVILSIAADNKHLETLGQGELLANRKEMAPLKKHAQKRLTSVGYVSESFMAKANTAKQQIDQLTGMAEQFLPFAGLDPQLQAELVKDLKALGEDIKKAIPQSGAVSGFSFLSDRGTEGFSYNWGENKSLDGSKPLSILDHVGGDPLLVFAARGKYSPESYDTFAKWVERIYYYGDKIGAEQFGEEERALYEKVRDDLLPLAKQLDQVTREKLIPAFKDGQGAFVFDAKTKSANLHAMLPPAPEPLPIPEVGLVYGVSDAGLLKEAASSYYEIAQKVVDVLHQAEPNSIPEIKIPPPESRDFPGGTIYYYRLPAQAGLDKQIAPNAGLSDTTLVLSLVPKMTVRLIGNKPLQATGPLANRNRPLAAAFNFNVSGFLDAVAPWVDYGIAVSGEEVDTSITDQIATGIEVAKCLRGASGVTYQEGGAWVTHYEIRYQDLGPGVQ